MYPHQNPDSRPLSMGQATPETPTGVADNIDISAAPTGSAPPPTVGEPSLPAQAADQRSAENPPACQGQDNTQQQTQQHCGPPAVPTPVYPKTDPRQLENIPQVVRDNARFCVYRATPRGGGKWAKIPKNPRTGLPADTSDRATFGTYDEAVTALTTGDYTGVGILIEGSVIAFDLDHCLDASGTPNDLARDVMSTMAGAYIERSPSGTGLRILAAMGNVDAINKDVYYTNNQKIGMEVYTRNTPHYVTLTGRVESNGDLVERGSQVMVLLDKYMRRPQPLTPSPAPVQAGSPPADPAALQAADQQLLDSIMQTPSGPKLAALLAGDLSAYGGDHSAADMAAVNFLSAFTDAPDQVDRVIRGSALMRPKWDRPQSGSTYGRITIAKALASARQYRQEHGLTPEQIKSVFVQASPQQLLPGPPAAAQPTQTSTTAITPAMVLQRQYGTPISAAELEKMPFPPLRFLIDGMLTEGVAILAAAPKIGKSWLCLDLCTAIASGTPFWGRQTSQSEVLYLALEDGQRRLQSRLRKILQGNSFPVGLYLATAAPNTGAGLYTLLDSYLEKNPHIKVLVIDTLQKIRKEQPTNKGLYASDYAELASLKQYADKRGLSIILVHHLRKSQDETDPLNNLSGTQGIAGAVDTIWVLVKDKRYDNEATLYTTSRDVGQGSYTIRFDQDTCRWEYLGTADEIDGQRAQDDYDHDELVTTIKELVSGAKDGTWTGSASDILRAGQAGRRLVGLSAQKVGYRIRDICSNLETYDQISHIAAATNGTGGLRHTFYVKPTPLPIACAPTGRYDPDEDGDETLGGE